MMIDGNMQPRLSPGVKLQFDRARDQWILQAPERIFVLDEIAHEILQRCTGKAELRMIVSDLCTVFEADRQEVERDVEALIGSLLEKRILTT
jgi:pyrroloquinoline quinone biosynthesis protein D